MSAYGNLLFDIPMSDIQTLGDYRMNSISEIMSEVLAANMLLSYEAAISGAMRWPREFRPEVCVETSVRLN